MENLASTLATSGAARLAPARGRAATPLSVFWRRSPRPLRAAAIGLMRGLSQPSSANGWAIALLLGYAILWTITIDVVNLGVPLHGDMLEAFALSRELAAGYAKHPPLI